MILKIEAPHMPWFRFEWHPENRCLYVIRTMSRDANIIADNVESEREARLGVTSFLAGYRNRATEHTLQPGDGPRHHGMKAEGVRLFAKGN